ncbi:urea transporter [Streptomyces drozdowiczii]|uniref:Urea transporter n=1 Tax=Streptomyces drozdowiczii TaxID=202862 RepID=A0ABY6PLV3_9ACTN|nr:urea transporter [Streptomyces drozdowiczii]MCX0247437.1 urea transporter [Streptomyces drozdowiczii]UZK53167.1 urea transporter [Streptomyces drozdowiczii]
MSLAEPDVVRRLESRQPSAYLLASLRGVGQVDFQAGLFTGAAILAGLWAAGWETGLFATLGTLIATAAAYALAVDRGSIALGMQGFAGCLTGIALVSTLGNHPATYVLTVVGAVLCVILMATLATLLTPYRLSPMTAPFCLVSGVMVVGAPSFDRVWHGPPAAVSSTTSGDTGITWNDLWHAFFNNVSQVFLVESWYVGLIMLVGLALAGPRVVLWAAAGSVAGIVAAWLLGAPTALIANGIYGYNAVLVAIGLGAVFLAPTVWNGIYALFGAVVSTGLTASLTSFFKPFGGHTFTWPFILTTWTLLAAVPLLPRLRRGDG